MKRHETTIDDLMFKNGIRTDKELAEKMGISQQLLSAKVRGSITINTLEEIADYFNVPIKELLR